ncbi:MAG: biosynthetic arginine decarboxylase [Candidatus Eisenbacteria bacterium]|uniref:arginine decarboxylase n=1 Tax=Eiseniibacteriota bacterium TaxID=2212470 RepID=A0A937X5L2_UNCEI|nr:biosynthetic arginine decarboxylase [Candidatus Eisenbacteria bacterium]
MARNAKVQSPYGVEEWGGGYFSINPEGHLAVCPFRDHRAIDLVDIVRAAARRGIAPPLLVRFPQVLQTQLSDLYECFDRANREFGYGRRYRSVFPLKVNPLKPVVEALVAAGRPGAFGLEVGSKAELAIALAQKLPRNSWICINGFKDPRLIEMATLASGRDPKIVLVVERLREIPLVVKAFRREGHAPTLGLRCRLYQRGSGRWEASGGETSKFGLGSSEILYAVDTLAEEGLLPRLEVLHFHIGSQITSIRRIKDAVKEAARVYAKLRKRGVPLTTLNVGGGLGIDYDGSRTPSDSSVNYTMEEFANNVVYTVQEVCQEEEVAPPDLVSESGRALTAYHSLLITNCESRESDVPVDYTPEEPRGARGEDKGAEEEEDPPPQLKEMADIAREISVKNFREYYHDAVTTRSEVLNLFGLGYLSLEAKARAEQDFYAVCRKALRFARQTGVVSDELRALEKAFRAKYVTNFSVFQSVPDAWAIEQLFPIVPIHRLNETPTVQGVLVDLTCDSDGVIDSFVDVRDVKEVLELHAGSASRPYLLAICLLGAYQDVMGDHHNLFGRPAELAVSYQRNGLDLRVLARGEDLDRLARLAGYEPEALRETFLKRRQRRRKAPPPAPDLAEATGAYDRFWKASPYLESDPELYEELE